MARINDAWHILSDPIRRARWERLNTVIAPPHWAPAPVEVARRPRPVPQAPPSPMDSGWVAIGVLAGVAVVVAVLMIGVSLAAQPTDDRARFVDDQVTFLRPPDWNVAAGDGTDPASHRVVAHLVSFSIDTPRLLHQLRESVPGDRREHPTGRGVDPDHRMAGRYSARAGPGDHDVRSAWMPMRSSAANPPRSRFARRGATASPTGGSSAHRASRTDGSRSAPRSTALPWTGKRCSRTLVA